jgi:hypothetical protein
MNLGGFAVNPSIKGIPVSHPFDEQLGVLRSLKKRPRTD